VRPLRQNADRLKVREAVSLWDGGPESMEMLGISDELR